MRRARPLARDQSLLFICTHTGGTNVEETGGECAKNNEFGADQVASVRNPRGKTLCIRVQEQRERPVFILYATQAKNSHASPYVGIKFKQRNYSPALIKIYLTQR